MLRATSVVVLGALLAGSAFAADWTEYRSGPLYVLSNAGDGKGRDALTQMEQIRWTLGGMIGADPRGHADLDAIWPITLVLFDDKKDQEANKLPAPFVEGGSANLSTEMTPSWRSAIVQQLIEANSGTMPPEIETALADLFSTIRVDTTRVYIGAPVEGLSPERHRAWARLHMLAVHPDYAGRFRVYLANLAGGDTQVASFNTYGVSSSELNKKMDAYADAGVFQEREIFGAAIDPSEAFYERRMPASQVDSLLAEVKAAAEGHPMFPPDSARGLAAMNTREALYQAIAKNPKWAKPHVQLAALMQNPRDRIAPLTKATELEPRQVAYWEALARAQSEAELYIDASKSWIRAERAAVTPAERTRLRREREAIEEQRVDAEFAARNAARDEAERELRRVMEESDARIRAAEEAANRENAKVSGVELGETTVSFEEGQSGVHVEGRLIEVECVDDAMKLIVAVPNAPMAVVLVRKNPEQDGKPVFTCGPVSPARKIDLRHDGKADIRWNTVGEVQSFALQ